MISLLLIEKIAGLFLIMLAAFFLVKGGLLKSEYSDGISRLMLYMVYPAMMVVGFQIELTPELKQGMLLSAGAAVALNLLFVIIGECYGRITHGGPVEISSVQLSNCGNLIIPLATSIFGAEWVVYTSFFIAVQSVFTWTYDVSIFNKGKGFSWKKLLTNLNIIGICVGLVLLVLDVRLPLLVRETLSSLLSLAGPCGMILTGMLLASASFRQVFANPRIYLVTFMRMIFCPVVALLLIKLSGAAYWLPEARTILLISYLAAIAPVANTVTSVSQVYGADAVYASSINIVTTLSCIVTMPAFVWLYEKLI